jgi:hypothetical protein
MDEHKLPPASQPTKNHRYNYDYRDDYRGNENYYCQMSEYAVSYCVEDGLVTIRSPSIAPVAAAAPAAPAKLRQPGAKTNYQPF